ncbi:MAG: hypothetical protein KAT61_01870 [Gammaproteobacteria bacterium]|nr:hypothetical protein [Gammaproteobacteria bacterium]
MLIIEKATPYEWLFYAYMDVGKGREQERKLCPWMDGMPQRAMEGGAANVFLLPIAN